MLQENCTEKILDIDGTQLIEDIISTKFSKPRRIGLINLFIKEHKLF